MNRLTRPTVTVDPTAARHIGQEVKIEAISDKLLDLILNGPTLNAIPKDTLRFMLRGLYDRLKAYEDAEAAQEAQEPLTIEELKQMHGEPVWVIEWNHWAIVKVEEIKNLGVIPILDCIMDGVWHSYNADVQNIHCLRQKPKEV